ncbi:MAG: hypothetical protein ACI8T6_000760 [Candidatus Poseidoniaceae archaeon]|jgi:hypothetical protein
MKPSYTYVQNVIGKGQELGVMGWWPFGRKAKTGRAPIDDLLLKDNRILISELRDACELNFDNPEEARRQIRRMQVEWSDATRDGMLSDINRSGLDARAFRLLTCEDSEWMIWLDNLEFWKPGWNPEADDED